MSELSFSQRHGYKPVHTGFQKDSMDDDLRNRLWNVLSRVYWNKAGSDPASQTLLRHLLTEIWDSYFKQPLDTKPSGPTRACSVVRDWYFTFAWHEVYSFLEFVAAFGWLGEPFQRECNKVMISELSAYRFLDGVITPITSEEEIEAIETALNDSDHIAPIRAHLKDALVKLSDRKVPDFRNSIKESISAVESLCCRIVGEKTDLGKALEKLEASGVEIHGALESSFQKMYGYTSDKDGVRHAMMDLPDVDFEDAKFMIVVCSGFVSYLLEKCRKAGIKL